MWAYSKCKWQFSGIIHHYSSSRTGGKRHRKLKLQHQRRQNQQLHRPELEEIPLDGSSCWCVSCTFMDRPSFVRDSALSLLFFPSRQHGSGCCCHTGADNERDGCCGSASDVVERLWWLSAEEAVFAARPAVRCCKWGCFDSWCCVMLLTVYRHPSIFHKHITYIIYCLKCG